MLFIPLFPFPGYFEELESHLEQVMQLIDSIEENEEDTCEEAVEAAIVDLEEIMFQTSEIFHFDSIFDLN